MALLVATGSYLGNGADDRAITGVGFAPKVVIIDGSSGNGAIRTDTMVGDAAKTMPVAPAALASDRIQSLDSDGFTVGANSDVNGSGNTYYWVALGGDGVETFSYTGNGSTGQTINLSTVAAIGAIWFFPADANYGSFKTPDIAGTDVKLLVNTGVTNANITIGSGSFTLTGSSVYTNGNGVTIHGFALDDADPSFDRFSYTGTGSAHTESVLPFRPDAVIIGAANANYPVMRTFDHAPGAGASQQFGSTAQASTSLTGLADGGFEVGAGAGANSSGTAYYGFALAEHRPLPEPYIAMGSYVGNSTDNRTITGLGFAPKAVIIQPITNEPTSVRFDTFAGDLSRVSTGGTWLADRVQSLDSDGFTIGADDDVNETGSTFAWIAFGGDGVATGTYTGNATGSQDVATGFKPEMAILIRDGQTAVPMQSPKFNSASGTDMIGAASLGTAYQLTGTGFRVGNNSNTNNNGSTYHYLAVSRYPGVLHTVRYVGTGAAQSVTGLGMQPEALIVKRVAISGTAIRLPAHTGAESSEVWSTLVPQTSYITSLDADGFTLGSNNLVSQNTQPGVGFGFRENLPPSESAQVAFDIELGIDLGFGATERVNLAFDLVLGMGIDHSKPIPTRQPQFDMLLGAGLGIDPNVIRRAALEIELGMGLSGLDAQLAIQAALDIILGLDLGANISLEPVRRAKFDIELGLSVDAIPVPIRQAALEIVLGLGLEPTLEVTRRVALEILAGLDLGASASVPGQVPKFDIVLGLGFTTNVVETNIVRPALNIVLGLGMGHVTRITKQTGFNLELGLRMGVLYTGPGTGVVVPPGSRQQQRERVLASLGAGDSMRVVIPRAGAEGLTGLARVLRRQKADPNPVPRFDMQFIEDSDETAILARTISGQTPRPIEPENFARELRKSRP